jgi:hypothetical protein
MYQVGVFGRRLCMSEKKGGADSLAQEELSILVNGSQTSAGLIAG